MQPAIYGIQGERLTAEEQDFFRDADPAGYILFQRNCADREQLGVLTDALRSIHGRDAVPILIDQEGGRVARMKPPVWPKFPPGERFDQLYRKAPISAIEAARVNAQAIAVTLREVGINVDCVPLLDVRQPGAHDVIGDRALGSEPMQVAALGRAVLEGLQAGGVVGVVKHMPGHGRSMADSHHELPFVEASEQELETDLAPFRTLRGAPIGMTSHLVYTVWDAERPASLSPVVIGDIIRGRIGFDGLLLSDDLGMKALRGDFGDRAADALAAGCDIALHCSGDMTEMTAIANRLGTIGEAALLRLNRAMETIARVPEEKDYQQLAAKRDSLLDYI